VVYLEVLFVVSVRWMKYWFVFPLFSTGGRLPPCHPRSQRMVPLWRVAPPRDVLHRFGYTGTPVYRRRPYHQFRRRHCKVSVDNSAHPTDPTMMAWFTTASGDDLDDTLERASHLAHTEFCERHLPVLDWSAITLLPVWKVWTHS
jgi:hypothetical protein